MIVYAHRFKRSLPHGFAVVLLSAAVALAVLLPAGCKRKDKMPPEETVWLNELELGGFGLENTMTCLPDGTFRVRTAAVVLGLPVSVTAVEGVFSGDITQDGPAVFTIEKLAPELGLFVPPESLAQPPVVRNVSVLDGKFCVDIGIGQELEFVRQ